MDIFITETACADNINKEMLLEYQKKEMSDSKKLKEHCLSYLMTDRILEYVYKISDRNIVFKDNKPFLKSGEKYISISHSGNYIALGFCNTNCGIDIERMTDRDFAKIAERMKLNSKTKEGFYKEWTLYEAKYKLGSDKFAHKRKYEV